MSGFPAGKWDPGNQVFTRWYHAARAQAPKPVVVVTPTPRPYHDVVGSASDAEVCRTAIKLSTNLHDAEAPRAWPQNRDVWREYDDWVKEAKNRNLTLTDCRKVVFAAATDKEVCRTAVALNGDWETGPHRLGWKTEAERRGFTAKSCAPVFLADHTDNSICQFSIRGGKWTTEDLLFVAEAKRRGLTPAECESL